MKEKIKKFLPSFLISWYHFFMALFGVLIYRFPSRKLKVIGVTGTNGKSTVVEMASKILEEAGYKVASISSIKFKIGDKEWLNTLKMTMPGRFKIQKFLMQAIEASCQYAVLEVTSEGIKQHRHRFINFGVAVFTNLTPEHIEAHDSFEKYREAKGKLFKATKDIHIINLDDENAEYFLKFPAKKKYGYGIREREAGIRKQESGIKIVKAKNPKATKDGISFQIQNSLFQIPLIGKFNIYNSLAAICVALSQGISLETCKKSLEKIEGIPGRMEEVISQPFKVFVDYAFTPNALDKVCQTLTSHFLLPTSKLICVLGSCGGGRDKWKRPILGKLAGKYCNEVIVTNEDPYDENPMEIIEQVAKGAFEEIRVNPRRYPRKSASIYKILDRREAIRKSMELANPNDAVVITGKGCEPWICIANGKKIPWDDRQVVREELSKLKIKS